MKVFASSPWYDLTLCQNLLRLNVIFMVRKKGQLFKIFNTILPGRGGRERTPSSFSSTIKKTAQGIKLKLSDFKDIPSKHILQVKPVRQILSCCHGNKITEGTLQDLAHKKSEKSAICKDIELKFGIKTTFGPLN